MLAGLAGGTVALLAFVGVIVVIVFYVIAVYNGLVAGRVEIDNAWAQIDVQLKRRHDLIPNLVETVKGYAGHEKETLEKVIAARNMAMNAQGPAAQAQAENMLSGTLKSLFAVAEAYPNLKANENFMALQEELTSTENKITFARQFYNDRAMVYNTKIQQFPPNIIAGMFGFTKRDFFEVKDEAERAVPQVKF
ncbi:MAG: LemA family protein [Candidatus Sumerlaeaceae bacterium]|nr:LemA family protein [Candidatus Sumerlaeaceae bacterium]